MNCGKEYDKYSGICSSCYSDQVIPNEIIELELSQNKSKPSLQHHPKFGFPGEKSALVLSILISIIVMVISGIVSFGLFFIVLLINLIYLKISYLLSQKNMIRVSESNFKNIFTLSKVAAYRLSLPLPEIYITQDPMDLSWLTPQWLQISGPLSYCL